MIRVPGVYELPAPVAVTMSNIGAVHDIAIGDLRAIIRFPESPPWDLELLPAKFPAAMEGVITAGFKKSHPMNWALPDPNGSGAWMFLFRVGMELYHPDPAELGSPGGLQIDNWDSLPLESRLRLCALSQLDEWFDFLRTWLEIQTEQLLDHKVRVSPVHYPGGTLSSHINGEWVVREEVHVGDLSRIPATPEQIKLALDKAGNLFEPPLEHLLARDARAALARDDFRRAAIDAGTAIELVLNRIYVKNLSNGGLATLDRDTKNLRSLKNALGGIGIRFDSALDIAIDARNDAAHQGNAPSPTDLATCLEFMKGIIAEHGRPWT